MANMHAEHTIELRKDMLYTRIEMQNTSQAPVVDFSSKRAFNAAELMIVFASNNK